MEDGGDDGAKGWNFGQIEWVGRRRGEKGEEGNDPLYSI